MISLLCAVLATTQVYRLELTDEVPFIVGQDGVRRQVCIVDPDQYAVMTGRVDEVWRSLHKDDAGRTRLHGKRTEQIVDATNGVKVTVYEDGYRHTERFTVRTGSAMDDFAGRKPKTLRQQAIRRVRDNRMSERQWKMREALEARRTNEVRTVTLEHDAATGKDTVK